jgi:hypothetical protein
VSRAAGLKESFSTSVYERAALIIRLRMAVARCGINPQCMSLHSFPPLWWTMTGMLGEVSGAMLKRGVYSGRSRSRFQRTRMSLNSNVAVKRPHMMTAARAPGWWDRQGRLSIQSLQRLRPCCSNSSFLLKIGPSPGNSIAYVNLAASSLSRLLCGDQKTYRRSATDTPVYRP